MATGNETGGRRRRPPPTIDLKAQEVPAEAPPAAEPPIEPQQPVEAAAPPESPSELPPEAFQAAAAPETSSVEASPVETSPVETPIESAPAETPGTDPADVPPAESSLDAPPPPEAPVPFDAPPAAPERGRVWPALVAGLGGAGAMLALFLVLWSTGAFAPPADSVLNARVAGLEKELRAVASRPAPSPADPRTLTELTARVEAAEQATRRLGELEQRVGRAESAPRGGAPDPALATRLSGLDTTVKALNESLAELRKRSEENAVAARDSASRAAAAETAAKAPDPTARNDIEALAAKVAALESAIKTLDQGRAADAGRDRAIRFAIAAVLLRGAVERGEPYAAELAAAKALAPDAALVRPLEPFADKGLPRAEALAQELTRIASTVQSAAAAPQREAGLMDRLQANAERLVRIRPVNETAGDDAGAIVSRAEAKAQRGDLAGARADLAKLPEPARAPADTWIKQSEARTAALEAARKLAASALDALGKAGN